MSLGVSKSLEVLADLEDVVVRGVTVAKGGAPLWTMLTSLLPIVEDLKQVGADAPLVLPELKDLTADEVAQLSAAAYKAVSAVLAALG